MADDAALRGAIASRGRRGTHRFFLSPVLETTKVLGVWCGAKAREPPDVPCLEADRRCGRRTCFPLAASL